MMAPTYEAWVTWLVQYGFLVGGVVASAFLLRMFVRNGHALQLLWRICFVMLLVSLGVELSGARNSLVGWFDGAVGPSERWTVRISSGSVPSETNNNVAALPVRDMATPTLVVQEKSWRERRSWIPGVIWASGILGGLVCLVGLRWGLRRYVRVHSEDCNNVVQERFREVAQRMGYHGTVRLRITSTNLGPLVLGVVRPQVVLPRAFLEATKLEEQALVFAHEAAHLKHRDSAWQLLVDCVCLLFWWHPLVWWARRQVLVCSEYAADSRVVRTVGDNVSLAECLVAVGRHLRNHREGVAGWLPQSTGFRSQLGIRVRRLLDRRTQHESLKRRHGLSVSATLGCWALLAYLGLAWSLFPVTAERVETGQGTGESLPVPEEPEVSSSRPSLSAKAEEAPEVSAPQETEPPVVTDVENPQRQDSARSELAESGAPEATEKATAPEQSSRSDSGLSTLRYKLDIGFANPLMRTMAKSLGEEALAENGSVEEVFSLFLERMGFLDMTPSEDGEKPPRMAVINPLNGIVFARGSAQELKTLEEFLDVINTSPPQLVLEVKLVELSQEALDELVATDTAEASFFDVSASEPRPTILSPAEYDRVINLLVATKGVDVLGAPSVTTLSGRSTVISAFQQRMVIYSDSLEAGAEDPDQSGSPLQTKNVEVGPKLVIIPEVNAAGTEILLSTDFKLSEFLGYDDPGPLAVLTESDPPKFEPLPLPRFRERSAKAAVTIQDGQTVALRGMVVSNVRKYKSKVPILGDIPLVGRLFRREQTQDQRMHLVVFITPTIVDAAGNRVRQNAQPESGAN